MSFGTSPAIALLAVAGGGATGALLRHGVNSLLRGASGAFPLSTLVVNGVGCLLIGLIVEWFNAQLGEAPALRAGLQTGFLGALTTWSTFSLETLVLVETGKLPLALLNLGLTVVVCLGACAVGLGLGRALFC